METQTVERPTRKDVFYINPKEIRIEESFNVRKDYGDIDSLAQSIQENGVRVPIRGYKKDGLYYITDGHRRFAAVQKLMQQGIELKVPFLSDGRESTKEQRVIDMLICNDGKRLNPIEESEAVIRLSNYGYSDNEISSKTGLSLSYVSNLKQLDTLPKKIKNMISDNVITSTLAMEILRENKDFDKAIEVIETAVSNNAAVSSTKTKITKKDVLKSVGKSNSYSELRKTFNKAAKKGLTPRQDKIDLYNFAKKIHDGDYSLESIMSELFEPETEE